MPDAIFSEPQLASIYDLLDDPARHDLDPYVAMVNEFGARSIIDLGCGTGYLACRLAALGKVVVGIDPAAASLDIAKQKRYADRVSWIYGSAPALTGLLADLIVMTGNVAQVFVTDGEWEAMLRACQSALYPSGRLVFEVRDPAREAWNNWTKRTSYQVIDAPGIGKIESWVELMSVQLPLVSFRHTFAFQKSGKVMTSDSTLRFRSQAEITKSLERVGLTMESVRDAPDRPGLEFVFVARRPF